MSTTQEAELSKKTTSSVQDVSEEKPAFGSRFLTNEEDVWTQNAWDHVPPPTDQAETIAKSLAKQRSDPVALEEKLKINEKPAKNWDNFYKANANNFFRNRKWLHNEFPELVAATEADAGPILITEVGCGAGNSVFPLFASNQNPHLEIHAYDYSSHAIKLVQNDPLYRSPPTGTMTASVWDVTSPNGIPPDITPGTVDFIILVFVMSALHPDEWRQAINNMHKMLKPGGLILFRDYGRYDLTQLRFKGGRLLDENFYIRGDKTRVYFFELEELSLLFTGKRVSEADVEPTLTTFQQDEEDNEVDVASTKPSRPSSETALDFRSESLSQEPSSPSYDSSKTRQPTSLQVMSIAHDDPSDIHPNLLLPLMNCPHPSFTAEQLGIDRRLIVNRKRQLKMYRVWMQGKFRKL